MVDGNPISPLPPGIPEIVRYASVSGPWLPSKHRWVYVVIAHFANESGFALPEQETIAFYAGIKTRQTVSEITQSLEDFGVLRMSNHPTPNGRHHKGYQLTGRSRGWVPIPMEEDAPAPLSDLMHRRVTELSDALDKARERLRQYENGTPPTQSSADHQVTAPATPSVSSLPETYRGDTLRAIEMYCFTFPEALPGDDPVQTYAEDLDLFWGHLRGAIDRYVMDRVGSPGWKWDSPGGAIAHYNANPISFFADVRQSVWREVQEMNIERPTTTSDDIPVMGISAEEAANIDQAAIEITAQLKEQLALQVTRPIYDTWLADMEGHTWTYGILEMKVPTSVTAQWLNEHMKGLLRKEATSLLGDAFRGLMISYIEAVDTD